MSSYHLQRSIIIDAPLKTVRNSLSDYKQWPKWSPWLIMDSDATRTYSDRQGQVGATYGWSAELVGAGSMELMRVQTHTLEMRVVFVKPVKSRVRMVFDLREEGASTKVTWHIYGHLRFFMFWMKSKMLTYIAMDYERGLLMLKEYLERGSVASYVIIEGVLLMKKQNYIGIPNRCAIEDTGTVMKKDFETLYTFMQKKGISIHSVPFAIYNTFDLLKKQTSFISCIPFDGKIELDSAWVRGTVEPKNALKTIHTGRYMHLANGWMTALRYVHLKKKRVMKKPVGYEFYLNNPAYTPEEELITEIYLPLS